MSRLTARLNRTIDVDPNNEDTPDPLHYWATAVTLATHQMRTSPSNRADEKPPSQISDPDAEDQVLYRKLQKARQAVEDIEDQILRLDYERHLGKLNPSPRPSQSSGSNTLVGSNHDRLPADRTRLSENWELASHTTLGPHLEGLQESNKEKKEKKKKKPMTVEEQNRHINKVFMRESAGL